MSKKNQKILIMDSSTIITLALNGLLYVLKELKQKTKTKFIITRAVKSECIDRPLKIKKYQLGALQIKELLDSGTIELAENYGIKEEQIKKETKKLMNIANHTFFAKNTWIKPVDEGEISCLAVANLFKIEDEVIAIDERSTRMLCEKPENLHKLFEKKLHTKVTAKKENFKFFRGYKIIRSSEIVYVAYKKGLIKLKNHDVLDALLYATKFKGAAISKVEIATIKRL